MVTHQQRLRRLFIGTTIVTLVGMVTGALFVGIVLHRTGKLYASGTGGFGGPFPPFFSQRWAGYQAAGPSGNAPVFAQITLPSITCTPSGISVVSIWVGYDGGQTDPTVTQDGVNGVCTQAGATPSYQLWWEMYSPFRKNNTAQTNDPGLPELSSRLQAGDTLRMYVFAPYSVCTKPTKSGGCTAHAPGALFSMYATDPSGADLGQWTEAVAFPNRFAPALSMSECIVERPHSSKVLYPLPQFTPVAFHNCTVFASGNPVTQDILINASNLELAFPVVTSAFTDPTTITDFEIDFNASA